MTAAAPERTGKGGEVVADPVTAYARDVVEGRVVAGRLLRLACERHLRDMEQAGGRGLYFDLEEVQRTIRFAGFLRHSKGEWAGQPVLLQPWQVFVVGSVLGWKWTATGLRRFTEVYEEVGRKNGKTTKLAVVGHRATFFDDEAGAEGYVAATKRDQAKILWTEAARMAKSSPLLERSLRVWKASDTISWEERACSLVPLGADGDTLDGLNAHFVAIDEVHAHKTDEVVEKLRTSMGSRRQPLLWSITTAGTDRHTVCWELHEYTVKVLEGVLEDDRFFGVIFALDDGDDWQDEAVWAKANPNLGVSVKLEYLRDQANKARGIPARVKWWLRMHGGIWTEGSGGWIDLELWDSQEPFSVLEGDDVAALNPRRAYDIAYSKLAGRPCYLGLDLGETSDLSALALWFPDEGGNGGDLLLRLWLPEEAIEKRKDMVPYDRWVEEGWIETTPGGVVDYDVIFDALMEAGATFDVKRLGFDKWKARQLMARVEREWGEMELVAVRQSMVDLAGPTAEVERLLGLRGHRHGGNPVLRWMISNVVLQTDPAGNGRPDKKRSSEKIDGVVAGVMALAVAMPGETEAPSVYETRGMLRFGGDEEGGEDADLDNGGVV